MPTGNKRLKVVIDTNVFISGLHFGGKPGEVLNLFTSEKIEVYVSAFILYELENILKNRFGWDDRQLFKAISMIKAKAVEIEPNCKISIIEGKNADNRIIECAVAAEADYIISGDKRHILPLKQYRDIKILSPDDFLKSWIVS